MSTTKQRPMAWTPGAPPGRGRWWILWQGDELEVLPVEIGPAFIYRDDPGARLLLKTLDGIAYAYEPNRERIVGHAQMETPMPPNSRWSGWHHKRDAEDRR